MTEEYNGWTNHETWLMNLWLTNDESSYNVLLEALALPASNVSAEWLEEELRCVLSEQTGSVCVWRTCLHCR